jgi:uncharacterized membrane protein (UPF0127 family)
MFKPTRRSVSKQSPGAALFAASLLAIAACDPYAPPAQTQPTTSISPTTNLPQSKSLSELAANATSSPEGKPQSLPTIQMPVGNRVLTLQIASNEATRERGLMFVDSMPAESGMIFVFTRATPQGFWMRNTRIPLDIVYLDDKQKVVSIHRMLPFDLSSVDSAAPAMFAIELNAGIAVQLGLKVGDTVRIPDEVVASGR